MKEHCEEIKIHIWTNKGPRFYLCSNPERSIFFRWQGFYL